MILEQSLAMSAVERKSLQLADIELENAMIDTYRTQRFTFSHKNWNLYKIFNKKFFVEKSSSGVLFGVVLSLN